MSSTVALLAPEGKFMCKCGVVGDMSTSFNYVFEAATDSNWIVCKKCGASIRMTPEDNDGEDLSNEDQFARMAFWNNKKAKLGKYNSWRIVDLVKRSIDPKVRLAISGKSAAHHYLQTLTEILRPISRADGKFVLAKLGIKDNVMFMKIANVKWNWLSQAIKIAKTASETKVTINAEVKASNYKSSAEDIVIIERPIAHIPAVEKLWLRNLRKKGDKWYDMDRVNKWMDKKGICLTDPPKPVENPYHGTIVGCNVNAQKVHTSTDINNRINKLKVDEWALGYEDDDIDPIDQALVDNAYGEFTELRSRIGRGLDEQLFIDHMVGIDDTDCDPSCECPDEEDNSFDAFIYNYKAA